VQLLATATGGANVLFQFWVYNATATPTWSQLQANSAQPGCSWTPSAPGNYLISVTAQDGLSVTTANITAWYTVNAALSAVSLAASPAAPQAMNTPITLTASATEGANIQYQYWVYSADATPTWNQLQAYSATAACIWLPSAAGNYLLSVTAKDGYTGTMANVTAWYTINSGPPLTAVAVSATPASPPQVNTAITFSATATGGVNVQYQFWIYNASAAAWSQLQVYSSSATCAWAPAAAGDYLLSVTAKDSTTGTEVNITTWYTISSGLPLSAVAVTPSLPSPQAATTSITFTATPIGGTNVQYQFWIYNATAGTWSQLQAYSSSAICDWTPATAGSYLLSVTARDGATGVEANVLQWYVAQ